MIWSKFLECASHETWTINEPGLPCWNRSRCYVKSPTAHTLVVWPSSRCTVTLGQLRTHKDGIVTFFITVWNILLFFMFFIATLHFFLGLYMINKGNKRLSNLILIHHLKMSLHNNVPLLHHVPSYPMLLATRVEQPHLEGYQQYWMEVACVWGCLLYAMEQHFMCMAHTIFGGNRKSFIILLGLCV